MQKQALRKQVTEPVERWLVFMMGMLFAEPDLMIDKVQLEPRRMAHRC
jgi:hypothetical protein